MKIKNTIFKILIFNICLIFSALASAAQEPFEMRVFKVEHGNFVLLTQGEKALVVDCGSGSAASCNLKNSHEDEIKKALKTVTKMGVVVTHQHNDHFNGILSLITLINNINQERERKKNLGSTMRNLAKATK